MSTRLLTLEVVIEDLRKARRKLGKANHSEPVYFTRTGLELLLAALEHGPAPQSASPRFTEPYSPADAEAHKLSRPFGKDT